MVQVNLLPDIKKEYLKTLRLKTQVVFASFLIAIISVAAIIGSAFFVYVVQERVITGVLDDQIEQRYQELTAKPTLNRDLTVQNQLSALPELHSEKERYSIILDMLPVLNPAAPNSVSLSTLQLSDENQSIVFIGRTASYEALASFRDSLRFADVIYQSGGATEPTKEKLFSAVTIESSALSEDRGLQYVAFTIRTTYNQNAFAESASNVAVSIPNIQTSSQADLSRNLFEEAQ